MAVLTEKQEKLLRFYKDKKNWRPPTIKTMRLYMGLKSDQSIFEHLQAIRRKGYLN